jgi:putative hydrolase of the HAD superfamily
VTVLTPTLPRAYTEIVRGNPTARIRAICLDIDDTLVDYLASGRAGLTALVGSDVAWPQWAALTEIHYGRFLAGEVDFDTMRVQRTRAFFAERGQWLSDSEVLQCEARRMDAMRGAWRLFDDALPCLHLLRSAGLMLAAITNAPGMHQRSKLAAVGLIDVFDVLVIAGEVGMAKPDPAIFHLACGRLGVHPCQAVHVGDRLDVDAQAAVAAGLGGVWLNREEGIAVEPPIGVYMIGGLLELPHLLYTSFTL